MMNSMGCDTGQGNPSHWGQKKTDKWFSEGKWLNGLMIKPDSTINRKALAIAFHKNPERWRMAFEFLKSHKLANLEPKRYDIDGDNLYASVSQYSTENEEDKNFEAHRKYIDIQYVISGNERIGIARLSDTTTTFQAYDPDKDIGLYNAKPLGMFEATPGTFFIFFPQDAHKPGLNPGATTQVKKLVIKLKVD